jgi:hypothetical protein
MLAGGERSFDVCGLFGYGQGDDHGVDIGAQEQIVVRLPLAGVVRVEVDSDAQSFCRGEGARVDGFKGEVGGLGHGGLEGGVSDGRELRERC